MPASRIFRETPPWSIVLTILGLLNLSTNPPYSFKKSDITLDKSADAAFLLEPYYIPCKARYYLDQTDEKRWVVILKHIMEPHGWALVSKETTRDKKKVTIYSIYRCADTDAVLKQPILIDFN